MKKIFLFSLLLGNYTALHAQSVGINTDGSIPNSSAMLDIKSGTKGILIPRTSSTSRTAIVTPAKGLLLYDTTIGSFWFHDGTQWIEAGRLDVSNNNTYFGYQADHNNSAGLLNTGFGTQVLFSNTIGSLNTATGIHTLYLNTTGTNNTANGSYAMEFNTTGISNTAIGSSALQVNTIGKENTAVGSIALSTNTTGNYNTSQGVSSMRFNTTGNNNTAAGYQALYSNTTGNDNTALGKNAMILNSIGYSNVAIGTGALQFNSSSDHNVAIGDSALCHSNPPDNAPNTAVGSKALFTNGSGGSNTAVGAQALYTSNSSENTAVGFQALYNATNGQNTALGYLALYGNTTGGNNVAIGDAAMRLSTTGHLNVAIGYSCLETNTGSNNIAIGNQSITSNSGTGNIGIGVFAITGNGASGYNTVLGSNGFVSGSSFQFATALGAGAQVNCSNCLALGGNTLQARTKVGINIAAPATDLHIVQQSDDGVDKTRGIRLQRATGSNQWRTFIDPGNNYIFEYNNSLYSYIEPVGGAFVNPSDERLKKDILSLPDVISNIMQLDAKTYHYISNNNTERHSYGFLAQDVEKVFPEFVFESETGYKGIAYSNFSVIAIKAIQEQQYQLQQQEHEKEELKKLVLKQQEMINNLSKRMDAIEKMVMK